MSNSSCLSKSNYMYMYMCQYFCNISVAVLVEASINNVPENQSVAVVTLNKAGISAVSVNVSLSVLGTGAVFGATGKIRRQEGREIVKESSYSPSPPPLLPLSSPPSPSFPLTHPPPFTPSLLHFLPFPLTPTSPPSPTFPLTPITLPPHLPSSPLREGGKGGGRSGD